MNPTLALSGAQQAELIRRGEVSSVELVRLHLERIAEVNPAINAVVGTMERTALTAALEADHRRARGATLRPFEGVPFSVKDSIEVAGCVCTAGTLGFRDQTPAARDAVLVSRLRAAGAIPIARTNLPDLLFSFETDNLIFGRTNNPYDLARTPGGSSGGESALIASCGSPFGLGSDALGSVRLPAHCCGIASIKPTSGRLDRTGHVPAAAGWAEMVWQIGPMARRATDLPLLMEVLSAGEPMAPAFRPERGPLRVAFFTDNGIVTPDAATVAAVQQAAKALEAAGHHVTEARPAGIDRTWPLEMRLLGPDGGDGVRVYLTSIGSVRTHPLLDAWLRKCEPLRTNLEGFTAAWQELDDFRAEMKAFLANYDAVLSPVAARPAVKHGTSVDADVFPGFSYTMTHNLTGWPAAVVRCGESPEGLPINVQVATAPWREDIALRLTVELEKASGGWKPPALGGDNVQLARGVDDQV
jgi:amidase